MSFSCCGKLNVNIPNIECNGGCSECCDSSEQSATYFIETILTNPTYTKKDKYEYILEKLISLSESQDGFIGKVFYDSDGSHLMKTFASSRGWSSFIEQHGHQMSYLFGYVIVSGKYSIEGLDLLPTNFMCVPCSIGDRIVALVGLTGKQQPYSEKDIKKMSNILFIVKYISLLEHDREIGVLKLTEGNE